MSNKHHHPAPAKPPETRAETPKLTRWQRIVAWLERWTVPIFTVVLALATIYQFWITGQQLDTMRKDQRPWIKLKIDFPTPGIGAPIKGTFHAVNNGKTVAKNISGKFVIEMVPNGGKPRLNYEGAGIKFTGGAIFPNDPLSQTVAMPTESGSAQIFTQANLDDFDTGKMFIAVYGTVSYTDFFRVEHWTKYCEFIPSPKAPLVGFTAKDCTDYNDVDDN